MKKKKFLIAIGIMSCLAIIAFVIINQKTNEYNKIMDSIREQNNSAFIDYNEKIEYKTKWTYEELVKKVVDESKLSDNTNIHIMVNDEELNNSSAIEFDKVGSYKVDISLDKEYSYRIITETTKNIEVKKEITLNVEDTIYPVIKGVDNKTITVGDKIDLLDGISANDKVEGKIKVQVDGKVDTSKAGDYTIKVYAIDANGNRTDEKFTVTVKEKPIISQPSPSFASSSSSSSKGSSSSSSSSKGSSSSSSSSKLTSAEKDRQARAVAKKIAKSILAKGYTTDIDKVTEAAQIVSSYYNKGVHKESGPDYYTAYGVFIKGESSCAGTTRALGMVLEYMGYKKWTHANKNQWTHQWVIIKMDGKTGYADGQVGWAGYGKHPVAE